MKTLMRCLVFVLLVTGTLLSVPAVAQQERDAIEVLRTQVGADRQALVAANMTLSETQSAEFWPLYREYHLKRDGLMDRRVAILTEFRDDRMGMTAEQAEQILKDAIKLEKDILKLKSKYRKKFHKILGPRATLRYYQIENKLDTVINYSIVSVVPLRQ
jgi:hypothetical protein